MADFALCGQCLFYQLVELAGECRRRGPHISADGGRAIWPLVAPNQWCGEYRQDPRKEKLAVEPV